MMGKQKIRWWRGYELYLLIGAFWYAVLCIWLDLLAGSHATGDTVPGNPIVAAADLTAGHVTWPGGYSDIMAVCEVGIFGVVIILIRRTLVARAKAKGKT